MLFPCAMLPAIYCGQCGILIAVVVVNNYIIIHIIFIVAMVVNNYIIPPILLQ